MFKENKIIIYTFFGIMLLGALPLAFYQKTDIFIKINGNNSLLLDSIFYYTSFLGSGYTYVICLCLLILFRVNNRILLNGSSALLLLTIIVKIMKFLIFSSNHRPITVLSKEYSIHLVKDVTLKHASSFPSGHAAIIFSLALFLILNFNFNTFLKFAILILALMVIYSRIYLGQHFYIDVYIGSLIGGLCTIFFYLLINTSYIRNFKHIIKKYLFVSIFIVPLNIASHASVLDIIFAHTTIHIEPMVGIELTNSNDMPLSIDKGAVTVLTPGICLLYDNRICNSDDGWSTTLHYHLNLNCYGSYMMGAGIAKRYRTFLSQKISLDFVIGVEALVMTKKFLPTYNFGKKLINLAYIIMHDLPGSNHKIIFPTPIVQCMINHKVAKDSTISIGIVWEGVAIVTCFGVSIPITPYVKKIKSAHPPKRRYIRKS